MNIKQLRDLYGKTSTFALAYGIGTERLAKLTKRKPRLAKKIQGKVTGVYQNANYCLDIDRGETFTLKSKIKKGCGKGKVYTKVFRVKDKTVYVHVTKHRRGGQIYNYNTFKNLTWV